jgi:hypothetical protein
MKPFIKKVLVFMLPLLVLFIGVELYFRHYKNAFAVKASFLNKNKSDIEVLILGSSHHQNALNPRFFSEKAANLAYGSQDIRIDSALFFNNVKELKNLKKVVFELDYHRLDIENSTDYFRHPWYYIYYGIDTAPIKFVNRISLYTSNPVFFNKNLMNVFKRSYKPQGINEFGYVEVNNLAIFRDMGYDSVRIGAEAKSRLHNKDHEISDKNFALNRKRLASITEYCKQHSIQVYFLSTPLYSTYRENMSAAKKARFDAFVTEFTRQYGVPFYDYSKNPRFTLKDFADDDHLNPRGAEKYSRIIDSIIHKD